MRKQDAGHQGPERGEQLQLPKTTPEWVTPELVAHTLRVWGPRYRKPLSVADAVEIVLNVARLYSVVQARRDVDVAPR